MKEHFQTWGNFYQVVCSLIFGFISLFLWIQDRRKSKLIHELQKQSNILIEQLEINKNQDRPCLKVTNKKYDAEGWIVLGVENIGSDLYNLEFNKSSPGNLFKIESLNVPKDLSRNNFLDIRYKLHKYTEIFNSSIIKFCFSDKSKNNFEQILIISNKLENITFKPIIKK